MSFQERDVSSYNNLDLINEGCENNKDTTADTADKPDDNDDDFFVMRGKSSTISKCCDVEIRPALASVARKRSNFIQ